jgi:hypothetical protein
MNNESERMRKVVMAYIEVLSWHLLGGSEESHENHHTG